MAVPRSKTLDDEPEEIDDPKATKPEDWDDEEDGEWEAPKSHTGRKESYGKEKWKPKYEVEKEKQKAEEAAAGISDGLSVSRRREGTPQTKTSLLGSTLSRSVSGIGLSEGRIQRGSGCDANNSTEISSVEKIVLKKWGSGCDVAID